MYLQSTTTITKIVYNILLLYFNNIISNFHQYIMLINVRDYIFFSYNMKIFTVTNEDRVFRQKCSLGFHNNLDLFFRQIDYNL